MSSLLVSPSVYTPCLATLNPYGTGVKRPRTKDEEGERLDREGVGERILWFVCYRRFLRHLPFTTHHIIRSLMMLPFGHIMITNEMSEK